MADNGDVLRRLMNAHLPMPPNARMLLHASPALAGDTGPGPAGMRPQRFRLKVFKGQVVIRYLGVEMDCGLLWQFEVHDMCRTYGHRVMASGCMQRWRDTLEVGLTVRNQAEQGQAWDGYP